MKHSVKENERTGKYRELRERGNTVADIQYVELLGVSSVARLSLEKGERKKTFDELADTAVAGKTYVHRVMPEKRVRRVLMPLQIVNWVYVLGQQ